MSLSYVLGACSIFSLYGCLRRRITVTSINILNFIPPPPYTHTHLYGSFGVLCSMSPVLAGDFRKMLHGSSVLPAVVPGRMGKHLREGQRQSKAYLCDGLLNGYLEILMVLPIVVQRLSKSEPHFLYARPATVPKSQCFLYSFILLQAVAGYPRRVSSQSCECGYCNRQSVHAYAIL